MFKHYLLIKSTISLTKAEDNSFFSCQHYKKYRKKEYEKVLTEVCRKTFLMSSASFLPFPHNSLCSTFVVSFL